MKTEKEIEDMLKYHYDEMKRLSEKGYGDTKKFAMSFAVSNILEWVLEDL